MRKTKLSGAEAPLKIREEEDDTTLAAIDEGIREVRSGRLFQLSRSANSCQRIPFTPKTLNDVSKYSA